MYHEGLRERQPQPKPAPIAYQYCKTNLHIIVMVPGNINTCTLFCRE